jgi:hypothetical protein
MAAVETGSLNVLLIRADGPAILGAFKDPGCPWLTTRCTSLMEPPPSPMPEALSLTGLPG